MPSSPTSRAFRPVAGLPAWNKVSLVLWPRLGEALTTCVETFDVSALHQRMEQLAPEARVTWTAVWLKVFERVFVAHPEFNVFVRGGGFATRDDVDFLVRITLPEAGPTATQSTETLWGAYLRGVQGESTQAIAGRLTAHREKSKVAEGRAPGLQRLIRLTPLWLLRWAVALVLVSVRWGVELPGVPRIFYPSISLSNVGSLRLPRIVSRAAPLVYAPLHVVLGEVRAAGDRHQVELMVSFDHRLFDGAQFAAFFKAVHAALPQALDF